MGDWLYLGSCAGELYAFDAATGAVRWSYNVEDDGASEFHGNPLVVDSVIYVTTDAGRRRQRGTLYALNRYSGELLWKLRADPGLPSSPCAHDSLVYVMTFADEALAVHRGTGEIIWRYTTGWYCHPDSLNEGLRNTPRHTSVPLADGNRVYLPGRDSTVVCLNAQTGAVIWWIKDLAAITAAPLIVDSLLVFGTGNHEMVYLRLRDGAELRRDKLEMRPLLAMAHANGKLIYFAGDEGIRPVDLYARDLVTGKLLWHQTLESEHADAFWYAPRVLVWNDMAIAGSSRGLVTTYNIADGSPAWNYRLEGAVRGIGHSEDRLFIGTYDGMLYALEFK